MPYAMKIQPIDSHVEETRLELVKPVVKSRLKRLLERQFSGVLRISAADKIVGGGEETRLGKDGSVDFEPSSVCLAKMVQNFIEDNHEKYSVSAKCARNRSNCFNGHCDDSSDAESDAHGALGDATTSSSSEVLKGLVACASVCERNLLADIARIVEKNKMMCKRKDQLCRNVVTEGLLALGYDASICKSHWEKSPSCPAGEYEYIDVMMGKDRVLVDIDFRSEFEIARSTKAYKAILQILPYIFVGKCDRLQSIVAIASEAAKQSLKKKGMHVPPWRKVEYVKAKWLSPYARISTTPKMLCSQEIKEETGKQHLLNGNSGGDESDDSVLTLSDSSGVEGKSKVAVVQRKPPELKPKSSQSGLAAVFDQKP